MSRATKKTKVKEATAAELGAIRELGPTAGLHTLGAHLLAAIGEARRRPPKR
ncbi:MAG: hypothetical protein JJE40_16370 [Vicinamibacteria bacterium]|nr:hypothetical protein [Vicinamibacteria bacterium]